ncbi:helix-turn-helix domain-containing protein [Streptomyces spectabilis]|uniref:Helix-turn-helix domain-containing protein n=1 Tax=Streptomyces spectabilis TaxID=68270 RepID=A0A516R692_STRST|nr:helix-turn-helix domain-containing protein [Streptomyces spectabilis]QDQ11150.1 helix-turn-helix domain-containing protein [Streptomyces spectabilis]
MATVHHWTGLEAKALRRALRMSVRAFADRLGVAVATVSKWESKLADTEPRPDTQAILDTALGQAELSVHLRFETLLSEMTGSVTITRRHVTACGPRSWEYESWTDDLDRVVVALSHQNFAFADSLLSRWLGRFKAAELDDKGLYLFARSTALLGDLKRDQGTVIGPLSAHHSYADARGIFTQLDIPRRVAQIDLSLAVVTEMSGRLEIAACDYEALAVDARLSRRDRARARLWVGTALSKGGRHEYATRVMTAATRDFEDLTEPDDWSVAHQKLALARRGTGDLTQALHLIDIARSSGTTDSPMQRVRLDTAHGHILLSDTATRDDGLVVLDQAANMAAQYGLVHQLRSIEGIKAMGAGPTGPRQR